MRKVLSFGILLIAASLIIWSFNGLQKRKAVDVAKPASPAASSLIAKSDEGGGGVTVTARPAKINKGEDIIFEFAIDTHSGNLMDFAVLEKVILIFGDKEVLPKEWQETANSGHHRSGKLVFEVGIHQLAEKELELVIRDLAEVSERRLKWTL